MQPLLTELLNLPGIEVEDYTHCGEQLILEVEGEHPTFYLANRK